MFWWYLVVLLGGTRRVGMGTLGEGCSFLRRLAYQCTCFTVEMVEEGRRQENRGDAWRKRRQDSRLIQPHTPHNHVNHVNQRTTQMASTAQCGITSVIIDDSNLEYLYALRTTPHFANIFETIRRIRRIRRLQAGIRIPHPFRKAVIVTEAAGLIPCSMQRATTA